MPYGYVPRKGKSSTDIVRFLPHERFRMRDEFVRPYMTQEPAWGPVGKVVYVRTYARELRGQELVEHLVRDYGRDRIEARAEARKIKVRREEFWQTARRVTEFVWTVFKRAAITNHHAWDEHEAQQKSEEMFKLLWDFKWLPPGRGMQFAGTPVVEKKGAAVLNNCFGPEEVFITEQGPMTFAEAVGQTLNVLTADGWAEAAIKSFGSQTVQRVTFAPAMPHPKGDDNWRSFRSNLRHSVVVTPDHRWLLASGKETTSLGVGDVVRGQINRDTACSSAYRDGRRHGLIFGDGTAGYRYVNGKEREYHIRLCGAKAQAEVSTFERVTYPPSYNGDPLASVVSSVDLKSFPPSEAPSDYVRGFLDGWLVADSSDSANGISKRLASQHPEALEWLRRYAALAGWALIGYSVDSAKVTNYGRRTNPLYVYVLTQSHNIAWKVTSIEALEEQQEVYCAQVPTTRAFALANGIYTGNCGFVSTASIDADFADPFCAIMDFLMLGVGVGSDVKGAGKVVVQQPEIDNSTFVVDDSREGWVEAFRARLLPYVGVQVMPTNWDFSLIRAEGKPLKTFGGTASGHGPLVRLLNAVDEILEPLAGQPITETAIADLVNNIGVCVVAGNIRRSAEILLGEYGDEEFAALKDPTETRRLKARMNELVAATPEAAELQRHIERWKEGQRGFSAATKHFINLQNKIDRAKKKVESIMRQNTEWARCETAYWGHPLFTHRWASNNTVLCKPTHDFTTIGARIATNGEPGVAFMDNIRAYGRMGNVGAMLPPRAKWLDVGVEGFNPCAEQPLEDRELCCLGELNPNAHATLEEFLHTIKFAYMYCKAVTLLPTNHPETNRVMTKNRRIGLSLIGAFEMYDRLGLAECIRWFDAGYNEVRKWDKTYSEWLGCNASIKVTSLKPGGSVPLLVGKEGGMKVPSAEYYFRTIRAEYRSSLVKEARDKGYRVEKDRYSPRTSVMYFPVHDPNARRTANDVSMWEQLELLAAIQGYWSDNMVSNTINFKPHEAKDIPRAIAAFAHRVKAISFLPLEEHDYPQAPYIPISKEEYEYAAARCWPLDLAAVAHEVDEKYCTGDACEIRPR